MVNRRDERQRGLVPPEKLAMAHCVVVGVGAIGRQVALQLAAMGVPKLTLVDFDMIEDVNLGPQGYFEKDIGRPKVEATAELCKWQNPNCDVGVVCDRFSAEWVADGLAGRPTGVVFCCVDSMDVRREIWEAVRERVKFFVDGRMNAEVVRSLCVAKPASDAEYAKTLFAETEAVQGDCTARATIYTSNIAAGMMVGNFAKWLRGAPLEPDVLMNLVSMEMAVPG